MAISLIGKDGATVATDANPVPIQLTTSLTNEISYTSKDFTLDSFERLRVSDARIMFEYNFGAQTPTLATTIWESTAYGAGTEQLTTNLYGTELTTTTATATGRWIQSYNHVRYAPGISTLLRFTFGLQQNTNVRHRVGMFTDQGTFPSTAGDGIYFEMDGTTANFVRRYMTQGAGGTEERVAQSAWNIDKLNGTGSSGITLDWTKTQHLIIEYQWLGVGTIRFGFETGTGGTVWAHEMSSVNSAAEAWCRTGSLPLRAECWTYGTAVASKLTLVNCVVIHEGDVADLRGWRYFGGNSGATAKAGSATVTGLYPLLSLRAASTNDLTKRARIIPTLVNITVATAAVGATTSLQVALLMNPTPNTGATFAVTTSGSVVTIDNAATATTAVTGTAIWQAIIPNVAGSYNFDFSTMNDNANTVGYNAAGTVAITGPSVLTLAAGPLTGTLTAAAVIIASVNWKELV